jgi:SAM-dependent methyltransferase
MTAILSAGLRDEHGGLLSVGAERWFGEPDLADHDVLDEARGPVLDIGCGPGRHVGELANRGVPALGIDITQRVLDIARRRGGAVMRRSVFDRVPGAGRWGSALLLDGNIGIGGDPETLLSRTRALLAADGIVLVELEAPGTGRSVRSVRLEVDGEPGPVFLWSQLAEDHLDSVAETAGFVVGRSWRSGARYFARLEQPGAD